MNHAADILDLDHVNHRLVSYSIHNPPQWLRHPNAHHRTWAPSLCAASSCSKRTSHTWNASSANRSNARDKNATGKSARLQEQEPESLNAARLVVDRSPASGASVVALLGVLQAGRDAEVTADRCLSCLPSRMTSPL
jgi:hypothetical protein